MKNTLELTLNGTLTITSGQLAIVEGYNLGDKLGEHLSEVFDLENAIFEYRHQRYAQYLEEAQKKSSIDDSDVEQLRALTSEIDSKVKELQSVPRLACPHMGQLTDGLLVRSLYGALPYPVTRISSGIKITNNPPLKRNKIDASHLEGTHIHTFWFNCFHHYITDAANVRKNEWEKSACIIHCDNGTYSVGYDAEKSLLITR